MTFSGAGSPAVDCISCRAVQARQDHGGTAVFARWRRAQREWAADLPVQTEHELRATACSHGWSLDSIHIHDVSALEQLASLDFQQSVFQPAEVELAETTRKLLAMVEEIEADASGVRSDHRAAPYGRRSDTVPAPDLRAQTGVHQLRQHGAADRGLG